jgi:hypothetical protein
MFNKGNRKKDQPGIGDIKAGSRKQNNVTEQKTKT